jgi:hypothetical protein
VGYITTEPIPSYYAAVPNVRMQHGSGSWSLQKESSREYLMLNSTQRFKLALR